MDGGQLLLVIVAAIAVTALANRRGLQPPLVVVMVGLAVSFVPGLPRLELEPDIILGLVLPPLLYSTALDLSVPSFVRNLGPILRLGVVLVVISAFVVGWVAAWAIVPLGFGAALVLGAVVAPPDAVTAVAIGRELGAPKRVMAILTGESLVNDAAALTLFSVTVSAVVGSHNLLDDPLLYFGYSAAVGIGLGLLIGVGAIWLRRRLRNPGLETVLGLVVPFGAYLGAEQVHASGVLAVVFAGFAIGHDSASSGYATRLQERLVWNSLDMLLEAFVFAYIGLQLRFVIEDARADGDDLGRLVLASLLVLAVVMVIRPVWVFATYGNRRFWRWLSVRLRGAEPVDNVGAYAWQQNALISWTGMRGVVTLAAASGIPLTTVDGEPFPGRASIQFVAFVVAVGTLLVQGLTLPALVRWLDLSTDQEDAQEEAERARAQDISRAAAKKAVEDVLADPPPGADPVLLARVADRLRQAQEVRTEYAPSERDGDERDQQADADSPERARRQLGRGISLMRRRMLSAERAALVRERDAGRLDDEVLRTVLEQLDYEEAATAGRIASQRL